MIREASRTAALLVAFLGTRASAQPVTAPDTAPLAEVKDDKQLAETLAAITQDPAIPVDAPGTRKVAQALMVEGVKQLQAKSYDQALANFLEAYAKFPSPKILLNVASTLRDMGRLADAANTYQRYLTDPATGVERVAEVKELLIKLDEQLTILTVRVFPRGSEISIDAGPFIPVGSSLLTRVRPGIHLVRIRKDANASEITVNGFEGENKEVSATLQVDAATATAATTTAPATTSPTTPATPTGSTTNPVNVPATPTTTSTSTTATPPTPPTPAPAVHDHVEGWLITGTQYGTGTGTGAGNTRTVRAGFEGPEVVPIMPSFDIDSGEVIIPPEPEEGIDSGVLAVLRIDPGRGAAGGIGFAISQHRLEAEIMFLRSSASGAYLGARYRFLTGFVRPYGALGIPAFVFDQDEMVGTSKKLAIGARLAAGIELKINGHLSVQADVGWEHFFNVSDSRINGDAVESDVFIPTLGVIGRL